MKNSNLKIIDHKFEVLELLGSGQSGEVYRVSFKEKEFALKLLKKKTKEKTSEEQKVRAFKFEFALLKGLHHKNIVQLFDFGQDPESQRFYYTQELIAGHSLASEKLTLDLNKKQNLFLQALQGLAYLHRHQVLHGDLKPENLLVFTTDNQELQLKLIDFGLSHPKLALSGGTPAYMAPEKILKESVDERSDLYALAVIFYQLLTGANPFVRDNLTETLQAHLQHLPSSATLLDSKIPPVWSQLLERMLVKNPQHRIYSAEACIQFLESKGEITSFIPSVTRIPESWIGRRETLQACKAFLKNIHSKKTNQQEPEFLLLLGEHGWGQNALLNELKYEAELFGLHVCEAPDQNAKYTNPVSPISV